MLTTPWHINSYSSSTARHVCPRCNGALDRVRRRPFDRLLSIFVPVRRYRCSARTENLNCCWEGRLRMPSANGNKSIDLPSGNARATQDGSYWLPGKAHRHLFPQTIKRKKPQANEKQKGSFSNASFEDMAKITLDSIADAVLATDPAGKVIYLNKEAETLTGWSNENALGHPVEDVFSIVDEITRRRAVSPSQRAIREDRAVELALGCVLVRRDGSDLAIEDSAAPIHSCRGEIAGAVIVFHDARQSQSELQKMIYLAQHDCLTGLPNRMLLKERLTQAIAMADRHRKQVALLFLDLDHFKQINDSLGHGVGDQLLRIIAADLATCVRVTDMISRHGGDEFVILLTEIEERQDAIQIAEKIRARFAAPCLIDGHELQVSLSIGISVYPRDGIDADTLIRNADKAMYSAKEAGRNRYQFYHREDEQTCATHNSAVSSVCLDRGKEVAA